MKTKWKDLSLKCAWCNSIVEVKVRQDKMSAFENSFKKFNTRNNLSKETINFRAAVNFFARELESEGLKKSLSNVNSSLNYKQNNEANFPLKVMKMKSLS